MSLGAPGDPPAQREVTRREGPTAPMQQTANAFPHPVISVAETRSHGPLQRGFSLSAPWRNTRYKLCVSYSEILFAYQVYSPPVPFCAHRAHPLCKAISVPPACTAPKGEKGKERKGDVRGRKGKARRATFAPDFCHAESWDLLSA